LQGPPGPEGKPGISGLPGLPALPARNDFLVSPKDCQLPLQKEQ